MFSEFVLGKKMRFSRVYCTLIFVSVLEIDAQDVAWAGGNSRIASLIYDAAWLLAEGRHLRLQ